MDRSEMVVHAATVGATFACKQFRTDLDISTKDGKMDYVTEADTRTQRRVIETITDGFPDDTIVGEEEDAAKEIPEKGDCWVIDPIDGTTNFVRGIPLWATSVAAVRDEEPIAAANVLPAIDETYVANADEVLRNGEQITVSETDSLDVAVVAPILRYGDTQRDEFSSVIYELSREVGDLRRLGSAQATLSLVGRGALDGTIGVVKPYSWDTVAGAYMVDQAGGRVTDIFGEPWTPFSQGIVATNGRLHEEVLGVVQRGLETT
ncbi:inositol monophosphatase family protein [Haladaptatus sp. NG-SE-30]